MQLGAFTRKDYRAMPDDWRGELIGGRLVMAPAPVPYHQHLLSQFLYRLMSYPGPDQDWRVLLSPVDVEIDDRNVYQPDVLILPSDGPRPHLEWEIPLPMWIVEVLSPSTAKYDKDVKLLKMAGAGVREAWLIAPRSRRIEVCDLASGKKEMIGACDTVASLTVPGFELVLADYFV